MDDPEKSKTVSGYENKEEKKEKPFDTFVSQTTLHGFHFLFDSKSRLRRIFWLCLLLLNAGLLVKQIQESVDRYFAYEISITKQIDIPQTLAFPAISICNQNMLRKSKVEGTEAQRYLDQMDVFKSYPEGNISHSFDLKETIEEKGHQISAMLIACTFQGKYCSAQNFSSFLSFEFGRCYTFNSGKPGHPLLYQSFAGKSMGLDLILDAEPEEYYGPFSYEGVGFRLLVGSPSEVEFKVNIQSMAVSPGFNYGVTIAKKELHLKRSPYKSDCGEKKLTIQDVYSYEACVSDCYFQQVRNTCSCLMLTMNPGGVNNATRFCSTQSELSCMIQVAAKWKATDCACPQACKQEHYHTDLSFSMFPSAHAPLHIPLDQYRKRYLRVSFYYKTLVVEITKETPAYSVNDLGGDIGGNMGLFLGCSVLTVCEFVDFFSQRIFRQRTAVIGNK